ncbi:SprT-like domain-containing protein [Clostridium butyricum]|uniref:SprT-like domain-containing protein n=1 Tax=Clostridium butyricum TaxID=1492 RepID=UPI00374F6B17
MKLNTDLLLAELYKAFSLFNDYYYNNTLPEPSITIQGKGNKKNVKGYCTSKKVWLDTLNSKDKYEIAIIGEYINLGMNSVLSTLLHEMVHLYCLNNNINETSRNNTYHNKKFKEIAEDHGLIIERADRIGWSLSTLTSESESLITNSSIEEEPFLLIRIDPSQLTSSDDDEKKRISRSKKRKYVCPVCGETITATKEIFIICGIDKVEFECITDTIE